MAYDVPHDPQRSLRDLPFTAIGAQPAFTPSGLERFVRGPRIAVLSYARRDGRPGSVPIWYAYDHGTFYLSAFDTAAKTHAVRRDGRITLTIQDERPPYRAVIIDALAEVVEQRSDDPTRGVATRYFGKAAAAAYHKMAAAEAERSGSVEVTIVARPTAVRGFDNTRAVGKLTLGFVRVRNRLPIPRAWL